MTDSMLDTLVLGLVLASGVPLAGLLLRFARGASGVAPSRWRRSLTLALYTLGFAHGVLAIVRWTMVPAGQVSGFLPLSVALGMALAATTALLGLLFSRATENVGGPRAHDHGDGSRMARAVERTLPGAEHVSAETEARPVGESRLAGFLLEGNSEAIGASFPSDTAEFDARLRHANRMQSIGRLAGGIAHDFNNLLTSILTSAEMAQEALPAEHGVTPDLLEIRRAGTRASELTRQLLAFSRRDVSRPRVVDLNSLVGQLATMLRRLLGETISLRISLGSELPLLLADPAQLEQVIVNLVVNARDAMPGGGELQLRTMRGFAAGRTAADGTAGAVLEVQDTGLGMSADVKARAFEPFFTTKHPGRGTGLGLATCHAIVLAHGGEIDVASHPDEGSAFRVWLPPTEQRDDARDVGSHAAARSTAGSPQQTILVVEDDADVRMSTTRALRRGGYDVLEAVNGEDALARLTEHPNSVDLVVSDIVMPRLGGATFARQLAEQWPGVRLLFVSGSPGDSEDVRDIEMLGLPVLEKPYTSSILLFEVRLRLDATRAP